MGTHYYQHLHQLPSIQSASSGRALPAAARQWIEQQIDPGTETITPSLWATLPQQTPTPLWQQNETLTLSPSSIGRYMVCPRQFLYQHVLRLPTPTSQSQHQGLLLHALMETFNGQLGEGYPYTAQRLLELLEAFTTGQDLDNITHTSGLTRDLYDQWQQWPLQVKQHTLQWLQEAILDLEQSGYFAQPPTVAHAEVSLRINHCPELPNTSITGQIDALLGYSQGPSQPIHWRIVDYKTGSPGRYRGSSEKETSALLAALKPLPQANKEHPLSHRQQFSDASQRNYQIPLYYWAAKHQAFAQPLSSSEKTIPPPTSIDSIGLQVVRPSIGGGPGSRWIGASASVLEPHLSPCLSDLATHVAEPLRNAVHCPTVTGPHCDSCAFQAVCDDPNIGIALESDSDNEALPPETGESECP
ncbi:MAG: PD-(D/E)XK nuclease family protein [Vampirovibrionales bacterium]